MPVQLTIIGLGQIGTSVGLALAGKKDLIFRMGHDKENGNAKKAEKTGGVGQDPLQPAGVRPGCGYRPARPFPSTQSARRWNSSGRI